MDLLRNVSIQNVTLHVGTCHSSSHKALDVIAKQIYERSASKRANIYKCEAESKPTKAD